MSDSPASPSRVLLAAGATIAAALAVSLVAGPGAEEPADLARVDLPTSFDAATGAPIALDQGAAALWLSRSAVGFGPLVPGGSSAEVPIEVENTGAVPLDIALEVSDMQDDRSGAAIPAARVRVATSPGGDPLSPDPGGPVGLGLVLPGASTTIHLSVKAPTGLQQWLPAGDYRGTITFTAAGVAE